MVHTLVTFNVLSGRTEEFESLHRRLLQRICAQPGCREVRVHRSVVDPLEYVVYGTWESKQSWERAHQTTDEFKSLFKRLPVERHTLSRTSFFEPAYQFAGTAATGSTA
jgi:quinol monooxygenase YgiN